MIGPEVVVKLARAASSQSEIEIMTDATQK